MVIEGGHDEEKRSKNVSVRGERTVREMRIYRVILDECGRDTYVEVMCEEFGEGRRVNMEYSELVKGLEGEYVQGIGFISMMTKEGLRKFLNTHDCLKVFYWLLLEENGYVEVDKGGRK
jgi:hypothetical protein